MSLTPKQWIILGLVAGLLVFGWYFRGLQETRADFREVKGEFRGQIEVDKAVAEKLRTEALADSKRGAAVTKRDEAARRDPDYQAYLDSPIPEQSRRLYELASKIDYGPDGTDRLPSEED